MQIRRMTGRGGTKFFPPGDFHTFTPADAALTHACIDPFRIDAPDAQFLADTQGPVALVSAVADESLDETRVALQAGTGQVIDDLADQRLATASVAAQQLEPEFTARVFAAREEAQGAGADLRTNILAKVGFGRELVGHAFTRSEGQAFMP